MKAIFLCIVMTALSAHLCIAQNIGIGNNSPSEKLDVTGNVNVSGQLKLNGNAGKANQVLMKDASNNPVWSDMSAFKNLLMFDCNSVAGSAGAGNCAASWLVPDTVTTIIVECWGGGGGGSFLTSGAGGGYATAKISVTPGSTINFTIGAYGAYGNTAVQGGNTSFGTNGGSIIAYGGGGGVNGSPFNTSNSSFVPPGGGYHAGTGNLANKYFGVGGGPGAASKLHFMAVSTTEFGKVVEYGDGGDAVGFPGSGGRGGYKIISTSFNQAYQATFTATIQGAGGGADASGGSYGRGGRVIIHF